MRLIGCMIDFLGVIGSLRLIALGLRVMLLVMI